MTSHPSRFSNLAQITRESLMHHGQVAIFVARRSSAADIALALTGAGIRSAGALPGDDYVDAMSVLDEFNRSPLAPPVVIIHDTYAHETRLENPEVQIIHAEAPSRDMVATMAAREGCIVPFPGIPTPAALYADEALGEALTNVLMATA